ncbi:hypothetical protein HWV62_17432 [Athelia sp. TMB]|nr:hypothetical protein HWV62_17432 [Athelia sp. TMB]
MSASLTDCCIRTAFPHLDWETDFDFDLQLDESDCSDDKNDRQELKDFNWEDEHAPQESRTDAEDQRTVALTCTSNALLINEFIKVNSIPPVDEDLVDEIAAEERRIIKTNMEHLKADRRAIAPIRAPDENAEPLGFGGYETTTGFAYEMSAPTLIPTRSSPSWAPRAHVCARGRRRAWPSRWRGRRRRAWP